MFSTYTVYITLSTISYLLAVYHLFRQSDDLDHFPAVLFWDLAEQIDQLPLICAGIERAFPLGQLRGLIQGKLEHCGDGRRIIDRNGCLSTFIIRNAMLGNAYLGAQLCLCHAFAFSSRKHHPPKSFTIFHNITSPSFLIIKSQGKRTPIFR